MRSEADILSVLFSWRCENCWRLDKPRCSECCLPILDKVSTDWSDSRPGSPHSSPGQMLTAMERTYHPACFVCSQCGELLEGTEFLLTGEEEKTVMCRDCYVR